MINFMEFLFALAQMLVLFNLIRKLTKREIKNKLVLIILMVLFSASYSYLLPDKDAVLKTLGSIIFLAIICKFFLKLNQKDIIFYSIAVWTLGIILDIITMNIVYITGFEEKMLILNGYHRFFASFIMLLIYFVLSNFQPFIKSLNKLKAKTEKVSPNFYKLFLIIIIYFILGNICLNNKNNIEIPIIILFISLSVIIMLISFIIQQSQIRFLQENISLLTKNNEFYIELIDQYRILKHNLISNLNSIKSVSNTNTKNLINDLIKKYKSEIKMPKNFKDLPSGVNGLIYEKIYNFNEKNLNVSINNKIKNNIIEVLSPRNYNLFCEALGVTLDNALEATMSSKEKILYLEFSETEECLIMKVVNTFSGEIDIDRLGTKNYTSKKKGNGLGIFSIINSNKIKLTTSIKENKYSCTIKVNKNK